MLRLGQRKETLRWFRSLVLILIVVFVCHKFPFRGQRPLQDMLPFANLRAKSLSYWMLTQTHHAVESNPRMAASVLVNGDTVNDVALTQILERPEKMLRSDTEHRGANADAGIKRDDVVILQFLAEAVD